MPIPPAKVLCIGVDAANPDLIRSWAADGSLPTFRTLFGRGVSGDLKGIEGFFVGSTWPSMYTGACPADHAFHYLVQLSPGTYGFHRPADHGIAKIPPFWSHLSRAGRRVAILDVPLTPLDPNLSGLQTVEWGGHDSVYGFLANPDSLTASIPSRFGRHPAGLTCDGQRRTSEEYEGFLQDLLNGVELKGRLTRHLLAEGDWDMFMQVFTESHCVGHQCWHLHDPTHPAHDPLVRKKVGDPLLRVYQAIDRALGEILEGSGDTFVLVFSAHSMSHWYGTQFLLRDILVRLGVAREPNGGRTDGPEHGWLQGTSPPMAGFRWVWRKLPDGVRRNLGPLR
ncbi:MAG: alkaline phosphatase family protein, partial [Gemmatimonadetes bacterium]|nr:alkaline phosphatase family protein [Gemmatimonadota bacterium]